MSADSRGPEIPDELARRSLAFLKQADVLRGLSPAQVQRIERNLQHARPASSRRLVAALATLTVLLLTGATMAVAKENLIDGLIHGLHKLPLVGSLFAPQATSPIPSARHRPRQATVAATESPVAPGSASNGARAAEPAIESPTSEPMGERASAAAASRPLPAHGAAAFERPVARGEDPIVAESRSFSEALQRWHRDRDAKAALLALDAHERRFPKGQIRLEAALLRAELLLSQGQEREGLNLLDRVQLGGLPRARELHTVRGELRIKFGRCAEGRADLAAVLDGGGTDGFGVRATRALAHCP